MSVFTKTDEEVKAFKLLDWPLGKIQSNCAKYFQRREGSVLPDSARRPVVLITTGAMNPVHLAHIDSMRCAKRTLEALGFLVVGGFLSPTHDGYVQSKCSGTKSVWIHGKRRASLLCDAIAELKNEDFLEASGWEINQKVFVDFPEVVAECEVALSEKIANWTGMVPLIVYGSYCTLSSCSTSNFNSFPSSYLFFTSLSLGHILVCGEDHLRNIYKDMFTGNQGLCVIRRAADKGQKNLDRDLMALKLSSHFFVVNHLSDAHTESASSTRVRQYFLRGQLGPADEISSMLCPSTLLYLRAKFESLLRMRRVLYISASALARKYKSNSNEEAISSNALFFFGSKRFWLFPSSELEREEARQQPSGYENFPSEFKRAILVKEQLDQVCFLKPDTLGEIDIEGICIQI